MGIKTSEMAESVFYASQETISPIIAPEHNVELAEITVTPGKLVRITTFLHRIHKS
jgi:hypothetical protein